MKTSALPVLIVVGVVVTAACTFRDTDKELKEYLESVDDIEELFTAGMEEIGADRPWFFGVGDPPSSWSQERLRGDVIATVSEVIALADSACRAVSTLDPPEQAAQFNAKFQALLCDYAGGMRDARTAVERGDLVALSSLALLSYEYDRRVSDVAAERERLGKKVN